MTEETKQKIIATKKLNKAKREAGIVIHKKNVWGKPTIFYTGLERDAFDFVSKVKDAFCRQGNYIGYRKVIHEIVDPKIWENVGIVMRILEKYCVLEKKEKPVKVKRVYKKKEKMNDPL